MSSQPHIRQDEVANTELFEFAKPSLVCSICKGILIEPQQCTTCLGYFCLECVKISKIKSERCPVKNCMNFNYIESESSKNMLPKLKFKCRNGCEQIIDYANLKNHYEKECPKMDFSEKYLELLSEYNFIKFKMAQKEKNMTKLNDNLNHLRDAHYFILKMQQHPGINRTDWGYIENKMSGKMANFQSLFDKIGNGEIQPEGQEQVEFQRRSFIRRVDSEENEFDE